MVSGDMLTAIAINITLERYEKHTRQKVLWEWGKGDKGHSGSLKL